MKTILKQIAAVCAGIMIAGCGGGGGDDIERATIDDSNYLDAAKAMATVNEHLIGTMEVLGFIIGVIGDGICESGTITHSDNIYTFDRCIREGGIIDGTLDYSYTADILDVSHMELTVSATDGSAELLYTDSHYRITFEEGSDDGMAKIDISRSGYYKQDGSVTIVYLGYRTNYDQSSATDTYENYNGSFILSAFSDQAVRVQTEDNVLYRSGDDCPSDGTISIIGEDSSLVLDIQNDFSIDLILNGEDKPSLADCDAIGEYPL